MLKDKLKKIARRTLYFCLYTALAAIILLSFDIFAQSKINSNNLPSLFGRKLLAVQTDEAKIIALSGDLVVLKCASADELYVGDNVAAKTSRGIVLGTIKKEMYYNSTNSYVIESASNSGGSYIRIISAQNIEGKVHGKIGNLGNITTVIQRYYIVIIIFGSLFFYFMMYDILTNLISKPNFLSATIE